jgi:uncharacterized NAD-dependent epimerase/dehydratase family protein
LLFGEELQDVVFRGELAGNPFPDRGGIVQKADAFVAGLKAFRDEVHDDIVEEVFAAIVEGADVIAGLESEVRAVS